MGKKRIATAIVIALLLIGGLYLGRNVILDKLPLGISADSMLSDNGQPQNKWVRNIKESTLPGYKGTTIGKAFDYFFANPEWTYDESPNGIKTVTMKGSAKCEIGDAKSYVFIEKIPKHGFEHGTQFIFTFSFSADGRDFELLDEIGFKARNSEQWYARVDKSSQQETKQQILDAVYNPPTELDSLHQLLTERDEADDEYARVLQTNDRDAADEALLRLRKAEAALGDDSAQKFVDNYPAYHQERLREEETIQKRAEENRRIQQEQEQIQDSLRKQFAEEDQRRYEQNQKQLRKSLEPKVEQTTEE